MDVEYDDDSLNEVNEEEDDDDDDGDGEFAEDQSCALTLSGRMPIVGQKMLPEDILRAKEEEENAWMYNIETKALFDPVPIDHPAYNISLWPSLRERADEAFTQQMAEWERKITAVMKRSKWSSFPLASYEDRELIAKITVSEANRIANKRRKEVRERPLIGDDIGTGPASPDAYVEIRPRLAPEDGGAKKQAANYLVSEALGISCKKASRLVELGSVWMWDEFPSKAWVRMETEMFVEHHTVLRVFPNPVRHKTCYVKDWRERVKKVDPDFVVVDKPPLLPCFAKVSNGREALGQCLREGMHVRHWGGVNNPITEEFRPCHEIDDEASGLIVLSRHPKAVEAFDGWLRQKKVIFEFVALCTANVELGIYRHFFEKSKRKSGQPKPALYDEIPRHLVKSGRDYDNWDIAEMEVVATAPLAGNCAAVRIRTNMTGYKERIRTQLALLGAPVLNDSAAVSTGSSVPSGAGLAAGQLRGDVASTLASTTLLGGAVDDDVLRGPYGHKLELLKGARQAADRGVSQRPRKKSPVALHLARVEFGGRVVTCAPPAYWPEGAAAAVAIRLTTGDIKTNVHAFLVSQGGHSRFGQVGGKFGVRVEWLEEHFLIDRAAGVVFASELAKKDWIAARRVRFGKKAWMQEGAVTPKEDRKKFFMRLREKYLSPADWGKKRLPRWKEIKKGLAKPVNDVY